jgi:hypothetical protein
MFLVPLSTVVGHVAKMCAMTCFVRLFLGMLATGFCNQIPVLPHILRRKSKRMILFTVLYSLLLLGFDAGMSSHSCSSSMILLLFILLGQKFPIGLYSDFGLNVWSPCVRECDSIRNTTPKWGRQPVDA